MVERIYDKSEFLDKVGLSGDALDAFIKAQVLRPAGRVDGETPYFDEQGEEAAEAIVKLLEIGYSVEEVIRIRRKVGLPRKGAVRSAQGKPLLTVGELAKRIGSNARTIKHWEEKGIIEPEVYSPGGYRMYSEVYVKLCRLIQDLQLFGYSLDEIKVVADLFRDFLAVKKSPGDFTPDVIVEKARVMKEQVTQLKEKMDLFEKGIERWRSLLKQKQRELTSMTAKVQKQKQKRKGGKKAEKAGSSAGKSRKAAGRKDKKASPKKEKGSEKEKGSK